MRHSGRRNFVRHPCRTRVPGRQSKVTDGLLFVRLAADWHDGPGPDDLWQNGVCDRRLRLKFCGPAPYSTYRVCAFQILVAPLKLIGTHKHRLLIPPPLARCPFYSPSQSQSILQASLLPSREIDTRHRTVSPTLNGKKRAPWL